MTMTPDIRALNQDHNMAGGMASSLSSGDLMLESIVEMVNNLGNVPDYIRKLDGKRVAAEKSRDVQAKKIQDLEDEVERFVTKHLHSLNISKRLL